MPLPPLCQNESLWGTINIKMCPPPLQVHFRANQTHFSQKVLHENSVGNKGIDSLKMAYSVNCWNFVKKA